MNNYINIEFITLFICMLIGLSRRHHLETPVLRWLPFYLVMVILVNIFAIEYSRPLPHKSNHWIYNIYNPVEFLYFFSLLFSAIKSKLLRKISWGLIVGHCLFALYNVLFMQGLWFFNHYSFVAGAFAIVCMCLFYYFEIVILETEQTLFNTRMFWIVSGLIILYLGDFLIIGAVPFMIANPQFTKMLFGILKYLNTFMYVAFIVAFLIKPLMKTKTNDSLTGMVA